MKTKNKLEPKVAPKLKQRVVLVFAGVGLAIATVVGIISFFYLNLGRQEDALAANFSTNQNGNWNTNSTWVGNSVPSNWGNHNITLNHNITNVSSGQIRGITSITGEPGVTFTRTGNLTLQQVSNFTLDGTMTVTGNYTQSGAGTLRITSGDFIVNGNLNLQDISLIIENGSLIVTGNITTSNNATITTSSGVSGNNISLTGGGISVGNGGITSTGNVTLSNSAVFEVTGGIGDVNIAGNLAVNNSADVHFSSTGEFNVGGNLTTNGGSTKEININSGSFNVDGDISLASASTINISENASLSGNNLSTGNNSDAIINVAGNLNITENIDLGGVLNIDNTGHATVGNNFTMRNSGSTATTIDGFMEVGNDININQVELTGTGLLDWKGDLNLNGSDAEINGQKNIPPPILDLGLMATTVLPVELLSLTAETDENTVKIQWQTASELNNDYFTIERSSNGIDFKSIAEIKGNGTTKDISDYTYSDSKPLLGLSYYRLKQTDFDGTTETFRPVSVNVQSLAENKVDIYPNPLLGSTLKLRMESPEEGNVEIFNQNGTMIFNRSLEGLNTEEEMEMPGNLRAGIYFVNVKTASIQKSFKLIKR